MDEAPQPKSAQATKRPPEPLVELPESSLTAALLIAAGSRHRTSILTGVSSKLNNDCEFRNHEVNQLMDLIS